MNKIITYQTIEAENETLRHHLFLWQLLAYVLFAFAAIIVAVLVTACGEHRPPAKPPMVNVKGFVVAISLQEFAQLRKSGGVLP